MELKIQALHFTATQQLQAFIQKKCSKLQRVNDSIVTVEAVLEVVKPETSLNKQVRILLTTQGSEFHAEKTCDSFEQAVDECVEALSKQLTKSKEKQREK